MSLHHTLPIRLLPLLCCLALLLSGDRPLSRWFTHTLCSYSCGWKKKTQKNSNQKRNRMKEKAKEEKRKETPSKKTSCYSNHPQRKRWCSEKRKTMLSKNRKRPLFRSSKRLKENDAQKKKRCFQKTKRPLKENDAGIMLILSKQLNIQLRGLSVWHLILVFCWVQSINKFTYNRTVI